MKRLFPTCTFFFSLGVLPASAIIDENSNGLSDLWEMIYNNGQLLAIDPMVDSDHDGWTNAQEAAAGTNPFVPAPPDGLVRPTTTNIPIFWADSDADGDPDPITPAAIILNWPTIPGKLYTLSYSPDLSAGSWSSVDDPFIGNGFTVEYGFPLTEIANNDPPPDKLFWRVAVEDVDSNDDGVTDAEQYQRSADIDGDGFSLLEEIQHGTSPTNSDTDGDGIPDSSDANPTVADFADFTATSLMVISPQQYQSRSPMN